MSEYRKIKNLVVSDSGNVFNAGRQVYPDNTGLFPAKNAGQYISSEDIMEAWNYKNEVVKGLDKQINHANLKGYSGETKLEKLVDWKLNHFKKPQKDTREKTFEIDLSKAIAVVPNSWDYTQCVQTSVQDLSKDVQTPKMSKEPVQNKWIVNGIPYPTAQKAADETGNSLKNIQRWCKNNKNNCSFLN